MHSIHLDMRAANSIFTRAQSADEGLIGILRQTGPGEYRFEACSNDSSAPEIGTSDMPVVLGHTPGYDHHDHLKVITDTRGVMQLQGFRCDDSGCSELLINTEESA